MEVNNILDPLTTEVKDLQKLLQDGAVGSVDLVDLYVKQIQRHDGYLRAMISTRSKGELLEAAKLLDGERLAQKLRSPLHGIPIIIKDNIATHPSLGLKTTAGNLALAESRVRRNAKVVDMLISAGVIILGKANLSELSNYKGSNVTSGWSAVGGQTQSAYVKGGVDPGDGASGHSNPSGSSSGPAVAVSAGFAPFSIGTETEGSLIVPAARAALYTIKPTIGIVPQDGIVPVSHTFDSAGPMAKSPYDLAALLDYMVVPGTKGSEESYTHAVTGSWNGIGVATLDPEVWKFSHEVVKPAEEATAQINREIAAAYSKIKELAKPYAHHIHLIDWNLFELDGKDSEDIVINDDFVRDMDAYLQDLEFSPVRTIAELIEFNKQHASSELPPQCPDQDKLIKANEQHMSLAEYERHLFHLRQVARDQALHRVFSEYAVNVIIGPADSMLAGLAACSGYPIASLPLSYLDYNGRPFGLAAIALANEERLLIRLQSAWEATFGKHKPPPALADRQSP